MSRNPIEQLDHQYVWHPFTQMKDWLKQRPIVIVSGKGAVLRDQDGREYLDANSSIWTNLHGHNHLKINAAVRRQLGRIAHSSALGLANEPASLLAGKLVEAANPKRPAARTDASASARITRSRGDLLAPHLGKVFFSDDGSTSMEVALKLAYEYARRTGRSRKPRFLSLAGAYHGDTIGAVSLGHIDLFHRAYRDLLFRTDAVAPPYCYRCRFNRAKPERADARVYRQCNWECIGQVERKFASAQRRGNPYAAMVVEPLIQGAAGMIPQPSAWLSRVAEIVRGNGAQLIADEVMTGFGRTGMPMGFHEGGAEHGGSAETQARAVSLFACHAEGVQPDFMALAKGLTGGYLPMAATLTTRPVFDAFLGEYSEFKTFFHGHSFTANQLGSAAAVASLDLLRTPHSIRMRRELQATLRQALGRLWELPKVGDVRQVGLVAGIELVKDWRTREPFDLRERAGMRVCEAMARRGVLTRPIGNVIVLMPPYCTTPTQIERMVAVVCQSIKEVLSAPGTAAAV